MKKLIMMVTLMSLAAAQVMAEDAAGPARTAAADAVHARVLETEALSWAWRIEKGTGLNYAGLEQMSAGWGRGEAVRGLLLARVKEIIEGSQVRRLTSRESAELDAARAEVRSLLGGDRARSASPRAARQAAIDKAAGGMLEVEAKHWAWRIAVQRDVDFGELKRYSEGWTRGSEVSAELLARVKARLQSGDTPALSAAEQKRLDAGRKAIRALASRA